MSCFKMRGDILGGGLVVCSGWGFYLDVGGRRRRNKGGEDWWPGHILNIIDGSEDGMIPSITLLAILLV